MFEFEFVTLAKANAGRRQPELEAAGKYVTRRPYLVNTDE